MFQKEKSVIQLHLQKNKDIPGKLSRMQEDDHSHFYPNQLLEFMHIWKISRQCLSAVLEKYNSHLNCLMKTQKNVKDRCLSPAFSDAQNAFQEIVNNIIEEVKNICSVLGCVEIKQVTDAINELHLMLLGKAEDFHQNSETSTKGLVEKVTAELSMALHQLIDMYCSSFYANFQPMEAAVSISPSMP